MIVAQSRLNLVTVKHRQEENSPAIFLVYVLDIIVFIPIEIFFVLFPAGHLLKEFTPQTIRNFLELFYRRDTA